MAEGVGFEAQFTSVMQSVLRTAVGEATKLFEQTLHQMKAELVHLRQENIDLKSRISTPPHKAREAEEAYPKAEHAKRDVGVQCEKPTMIERCCSPAAFGDRLNLRHIANERLEDLCSSSSEEGNRQLALLLIKKEPQETDCDEYAPGYFLLKQEGSEPILVRKEPFKNTMEKVLIPSAIQTMTRSYGTQKEISTTNASSPKTTAFCNFRTDSLSNGVDYTEIMSKVSGYSSLQSDTGRQNKCASTKKSTLSGLPSNLTQLLPSVSVSASAVLTSRLGQMSTSRAQQLTPSVQIEESHFSVPSSQQSVQNNQQSTAMAQFGPKVVKPSLPQNQNPITEFCPPGQLLQALLPVTDKRFSVSNSVTSLSESSTSTKLSVSHTQTGQNLTQLGHFPSPRVQASFHTDQHSGQVSTSVSQILPLLNQVPVSKTQVPVQPSVHHTLTATSAPSQVLVQSNDMLPPNSQSLTQQGHLPSVPHHDLTASTHPFYSLTHASFAPPFIPLQSVKPSVPPNSISQTGVSSPLEHAAPHYDILSDSLCTSSDQFFPSSDNTSDLLQPLSPMSFHSSVVLNQQETSSMIHSQSSGQQLQLAPLLTLKEQQAAASNHGNVSKRGHNMPVEISMSTVNNYSEHMQRYPPITSHESSNCQSESITVEMNENHTESNEGSRPAAIPGQIQHYTVLSKPGTNFPVPDSTKEQQTFRMNMVKELQMDIDINKQKEGCDTTCVWEQSDLSGVLQQSALSGPMQTILQKSARKLLEKKTECSECGRVLSNASSLENHMRLHRGERPYTCSQCGKAFPSVRGLNRHVKVHAEEKGYKCEECGRSFVYQFTLTKHKLIHSGDRPFPCKVCGKKFLAKADRATHMRMHTGEKPFFCNQCGKTFKHRVALNMHMQGHRGEKRYVCPHCEKGFVDLGNFKRHKRIHTGEKPFECKVCGKRFTQSAHLKKHINTQHVVVKPK
ncbi:zinc finger protein 687a-like [Silurus asotus]|uniref:Zinc finger protein 687a-like n=1 Tax=Silurus asotus TaxID=30991 RepID=A0AAD5AL62_SILAS|nr:zinc finger protein 687a-like [Silurus asotus]